jgi:hypothetical protein
MPLDDDCDERPPLPTHTGAVLRGCLAREQNGRVYDAAAGKNGAYLLMPVDLELKALIEQTEAEPDLVKRMEIIDQIGKKIQEQIAAAKSGG